MNDPVVFGYEACRRCHRPVLAELARKTSGHCGDCYRDFFRDGAGDVVVRAGAEAVAVRATYATTTNSERRRRRRKGNDSARDRDATKANQRARARLARLFPEIFEMLKAEERERLGLEAWTLDAVLSPHCVDQKTLDMLNDYHRPHGAASRSEPESANER